MKTNELWEKLLKEGETIKIKNSNEYIFPSKNISIKNVGNIKYLLKKKTGEVTANILKTEKIIATKDHIFTDIDGKDFKVEDINLGFKLFGGEKAEHVYTLSRKEDFYKENYSYDVTTETEHFMVNGLYSHNCRSFLTQYWNIVQYVESKNINPTMRFNLLNTDKQILSKELWDRYINEEGLVPDESNKIYPYMVCTSFGLIDYIQKKDDGIYIYTKGLLKLRNGKPIDWELGINYEILDKPNKNYICLSLQPKSLKDIPSGEFEEYKIVYNFQGNTGTILKKEENIITCKEPKTYGRWNRGVVTMNVPYIALLSKKENKDFWSLLDEYSELVRKALQARRL